MASDETPTARPGGVAGDGDSGGSTGPVDGEQRLSPPEPTRKMLPDRYVVREDDEGSYLTCLEAPNLAVRVRPDESVPSGTARRAPAGTIFLDGAAQDAPFMDVQRRVYNLDHHEGCVRAFTLASCEQAMVLVRKGLDLKGGDWNLVAGEPDLDTVLAVWVLLNNMRLADDDGRVRGAVMPLIRLEGVIDAHGLEMMDLCGYPQDLLTATLACMDRLRGEELELKREGRWAESDALAYTARILKAVDELVYSPRDFEELRNVEEILRLPIGDDRVALVCRSEAGIYEVEEHLERLHGDRIGLIILEKSPGTYTLRQADPFLPVSLDEVYDRLNLLDPKVSGRNHGNRWGGSAEIGGSPKRTGSGLGGAEVARICQSAYRPAPLARRLKVTATALATAAVAFLVSAAVALGTVGEPGLARQASGGFARLVTFDAVLLVLGGGLLLLLGRRSPRQYGLSRPAGIAWLGWLPVVIAAAWFGGSWLPAPPPSVRAGALLLLGPLACEALFRGVVQGMMVPVFRVQHAGSKRFVSMPALTSWLLGTAATLALVTLPLRVVGSIGVSTLGSAAWVAAAAVLSAVAANVRERAESVAAPVALNVAGSAAALALAVLLAS